MRMYCLLLHKTLWEQEIYNELKIDKVRPFLLEFEGQVGLCEVVSLTKFLLPNDDDDEDKIRYFNFAIFSMGWLH